VVSGGGLTVIGAGAELRLHIIGDEIVLGGGGVVPAGARIEAPVGGGAQGSAPAAALASPPPSEAGEEPPARRVAPSLPPAKLKVEVKVKTPAKMADPSAHQKPARGRSSGERAAASYQAVKWGLLAALLDANRGPKHAGKHDEQPDPAQALPIPSPT
jgi:hypothetical protein